MGNGDGNDDDNAGAAEGTKPEESKDENQDNSDEGEVVGGDQQDQNESNDSNNEHEQLQAMAVDTSAEEETKREIGAEDDDEEEAKGEISSDVIRNVGSYKPEEGFEQVYQEEMDRTDEDSTEMPPHVPSRGVSNEELGEKEPSSNTGATTTRAVEPTKTAPTSAAAAAAAEPSPPTTTTSQQQQTNQPVTDKQQTAPQNNNNNNNNQDNDPRNKILAIVLIILILLVAAAIAVGVTLGVKNRKDDDGSRAISPSTPVPTETSSNNEPSTLPPFDGKTPTPAPIIVDLPDSPLSTEDRQELLAVFASVVGDDVYVEGTTQALAADWIFFQDPRLIETSTTSQQRSNIKALSPGESNAFLQRYLLVFFYFSTTNNRQNEWLSCGATSAIVDEKDQTAAPTCVYQKLTTSADGIENDVQRDELEYVTIPWIPWLSTSHECEWAGVFCVTISGFRQVTDIDLAGQGLRGRLVSELLGLPKLKSLILSYNQFSGTLIEEYGQLVNLELAYNQISGPFPDAMFRPTITLLERLNVGGNQLTGVIPISLSFATHLEALFIFDNRLAGPLPEVLGQLALARFQAQRNELTGTLPFDSNNVAWASTLEQFWVHDNFLKGGLPEQINRFQRLEELRISFNEIGKSIPEALYDVSSLIELHLDHNFFTGTISPRLNLLTSLEVFDVSSNSLIGPMADVSGMRDLEVIRIQFNQLSGPVPSSTCSLVLVNLEVMEADCEPASNPPTPCECCTLCCDRQTETCGEPAEDEGDAALLAALRNFIVVKFGTGIDLSDGSPYDLAIRWIAFEDPMDLTIASATFVQRFVLAVFYYSTAPWRSCNPTTDPTVVDCMFDMFVRNDDDSITYDPVPATRWLSAANECEWVGVDCRSGNVVGVTLFGQDLSGTIPTELASLPGFSALTLPYNELIGTIPTRYGNIRSLGTFELHGNMLSGTIPSNFFGLGSSLFVFNVGDNFLSGTIPSGISSSSSLRGVHLFSNVLTGPIPNEFYQLRNLAFTRLSDNLFTGSISSLISNFRSLQEFWLNSNNISGTIPATLDALAFTLSDLRLNDNSLSGTIPLGLSFLTQLRFLRLHENNISGVIPSQLGFSMTSLVQLTLSANQLSGPVPSSLGILLDLEVLWLHRNNLTGEVPTEICALPSIRFLQADCDEVFCACCTACCVDGDIRCFST